MIIVRDAKLTFKRYEEKFVLSPEKFDAFMSVASEHLIPEFYHKSLVMSIYYDSDSYSLIRHSIDGPVYKEKIRLRSYGIPEDDGTVFVELKKKYSGVVYKRRVEMSALCAENWLSGSGRPPKENQITREIDWFLARNPVSPKVFIGCDRTAWADKDNPELRITFDSSIRWRDSDLSLRSGDYGVEQLPDKCVLMEIKIPEAAPLWLCSLLSRNDIFPGPYSKYGTYYKTQIIGKEI